jgi:hypothetical protein
MPFSCFMHVLLFFSPASVAIVSIVILFFPNRVEEGH